MAYPTIDCSLRFSTELIVMTVFRTPGQLYSTQLASTYNTAIYNGASVKLVAGGTIELSGATTTGTIIGVCNWRSIC
jgi:hypothetical protein